jgi:hypothetical protein
VIVFEVSTKRPYDSQANELERTRGCLGELPGVGRVIDFEQEQAWIERVHRKREREDLHRYNNLFQRRQQVEKAIVDNDRGQLSSLVRDVDAVNILLSGTPDSVEFGSRRWPALLSVPRSAIWALSDVATKPIPCVWTADASDDESGPVRFIWKPVSGRAQLASAWLLAVGPEGASYSVRTGLKLGCVGEQCPIRYTSASPTPRYRYWFETWTDHITRVLNQAKAMRTANEIGSSNLDKALDLPTGETEKLLDLIVALHDVGKIEQALARRGRGL